mmetsp:Transcript_28124/g.83974  ORF Transcript_28124/g.83974 Transcript_28124/m.83974 type:complete len:86 (-) Transcript_28124:48-305(-)
MMPKQGMAVGSSPLAVPGNRLACASRRPVIALPQELIVLLRHWCLTVGDAADGSEFLLLVVDLIPADSDLCAKNTGGLTAKATAL